MVSDDLEPGIYTLVVWGDALYALIEQLRHLQDLVRLAEQETAE